MKQEPNWNMPYVKLTTLVSMIWFGLLCVLFVLSLSHAFAYLVGSSFMFAMMTYTSRARNEVL